MKIKHNLLRLGGQLLILSELLIVVSCSVTSHLPAGEVLYTGVSKIEHHRVDTIDEAVKTVIATNLEVAPNSAFLGSAYHMSVFPVGLWLYNGLYPKKEHGFRYWLWNHFKSDPTLISSVNPRLRAQACEAALKDEGYFDASVRWDTVYDKNDSLKARLSYAVDYKHHSRFGNITYFHCPEARVDSIVQHTLGGSLLHKGDRFSASKLQAEQTRITNILRDSGYFFFKPDYIKFLGDSTREVNTVDMRILIGPGADAKALAPCTIDSVHYTLDHGFGLKSQHADSLRFMTVGFSGPQEIKTRTLRRSLGFRQHALYAPDRISLCKTLISRLNTFKYTTTEFQILHEAADSLADTTRMRLKINATFAEPWQGNTEIGCVYKDNQQVGPGITLQSTRRNLLGGGEKLSFKVNGAYEWNTGKRASDNGGLVNSFELGTKVSLSVPRLQIPRFFRPSRENPVTSTYSTSFDWIRRSGLFEMIKAGTSVEYGFSLNKSNVFTFTPLKLTYVSIFSQTDAFYEIELKYPALERSFENQFIPQMQFSYTFDNASTTATKPSSQYVNVTLAEAGGLCDLAMGQFGTHRTQGERQLFFEQFSQFLKATAEFRNLYRISDKLSFASRVLGGIGYAYGNSSFMPYSEKFYIGGPNSLRGFSVRGVGPGSCPWYRFDKYDYLYRVGDIKLEANAELRFPLAGSLYGALFTDVGNVWNLNTGEADEDFSSNFYKELALDTGFGFRLDLSMLVLRFDIGVPLHDPNSENPDYFNCFSGFFKNLGYNLAVGYPF